MFKTILWKLFPPKNISDEKLDTAYYTFENMRRNREMGYYQDIFRDDVEVAFKHYEKLLKQRRKYESYISARA